jgi:phosphoglycolate phosphatase
MDFITCKLFGSIYNDRRYIIALAICVKCNDYTVLLLGQQAQFVSDMGVWKFLIIGCWSFFMKPSVVVFDFDGTLVDTFEYLFLIGNMMANEFKFKNLTPEEVETFKDKTIRQAMRALGVPVLKMPAILYRGMKEMNRRIEDVRLVEGMGEVLVHLKEQKIQLGVVSTNTRENIEAVFKRYGLDHVFDFIFIGSGMLGKPRALKKAIQHYGLNREDMIYVADEIRDIEASRRVGISVASVTWGFNSAKVLQSYHPDFLVHHPQALLPILVT